MKRTIILLLTAVLAVATYAQKPADLNKAVVNVITYDATGNILHQTHGFLLGAEAEVVAPYSAFKGAHSASIVNWQGQTANVKRIVGANSDYDLVRATTDIVEGVGEKTKAKGDKWKPVCLEMAQEHATKGSGLQVAYFSDAKKSLPETTNVTVADLYNEHYYYELSTPNEERFFGCPALDAEGHVVCVLQKNVQKDATTVCAIDINFAKEMKISTMSIFNADLNAINIPKQIPLANEEDAYSYVYMLLHAQTNNDVVLPATEDFTQAFPNNTKIYGDRATYYANQGAFELADKDLQTAIAKSTATESAANSSAAELYHTQSILMYNKVLSGGTDSYPAWTLDAALASAEKAYAAEALPIYLLQQGQVLFTLQRYQEAFNKFDAVNQTEIATSQTFYFAANALERAGGEDAQVITLLDSAVAHLATPYTADAAPYLLARAQHLDNAAQHRRAVIDYNEYEKIVGPRNLNAYFYYLRMQAEIGARMYQQALDDAETAIARTESEKDKADYLFELSCLQLQVGLLDESIQSCERIFQLDANYADAYKICGVAYGEKKDKRRAQQYLKQAKEKGAENIDPLIEKYK